MKINSVLIGIIEEAAATFRGIDALQILTESERDNRKDAYIKRIAPKLEQELRKRNAPARMIWINPNGQALAFLKNKRGKRRKT